MSILTEQEKEFVELIMEVGDTALDRDVFEFMIEEGVPADDWIIDYRDYTLGEVVEGLERKGLAYIESQAETIHYNHMRIEDGEIQPTRWEDTGFKRIDRQYIYFTEKLEEVYRSESEHE